MMNGFNGDHTGIGWARSTQSGSTIASISGKAGRDADVNGVVSTQLGGGGSAFGPINDDPGANGNG